MKARLENAEKVKENGPKLTGHDFKLGDRVVPKNPLTKLWDTHELVTKKHCPQLVERARNEQKGSRKDT